MKVRATRIGYFNHIRRREGDVFSIPDTPRRPVRKIETVESEEIVDSGTGTVHRIAKRRFRPDAPEVLALADKAGTVPAALGSWMEPVSARTPDKTSTAQEALNQKSDEIKAGKVASRGGSEELATGDAEVI